MYVRWKRRLRHGPGQTRYAVLVEGVWSQGTVRQRLVRYLGALREPVPAGSAPAAHFWAAVTPRLDALGLAPAVRQAVEAQLARVVPRALAERDVPPGPHAPPGAVASAGPLPGGLAVRWKRRRLRRQADTAWDAVLLRRAWGAGPGRHQTVAYLASIRAQSHTFPAHRAWFWTRVDARLATLELDAGTRQAVEARLAQTIPRPPAAEQEEVAALRAACAQLAGLSAPTP